MTTRFKNAIDALVYAFFNDTLAKGSCSACAVGNIVAHAFGKRLDPKHLYCPVSNGDGIGNDEWAAAFYSNNGKQVVDEDLFDNELVLACVIPTGYPIQDLMKIERAFESATFINARKYSQLSKEVVMQDQYNGLMAVVDVLCEIEGIEDSTEYKALFQTEIPNQL